MLILSIVILVALAAFAGYYFGAKKAPHQTSASVHESAPAPRQESMRAPAAEATMRVAVTGDADLALERERIDEEKARIIRSLERETAMLRARCDDAVGVAASEPAPLAALATELAAARAEALRYRQLVVDIENNAPPPILQGAAEPDDLKLIVGVGPVLERMLRNLGIHNFRQIARWSAHDVAEFDARLPEFPGRIVRDQWVTQARALHESKYGESALGKGS